MAVNRNVENNLAEISGGEIEYVVLACTDKLCLAVLNINIDSIGIISCCIIVDAAAESFESTHSFIEVYRELEVIILLNCALNLLIAFCCIVVKLCEVGSVNISVPNSNCEILVSVLGAKHHCKFACAVLDLTADYEIW